METEKTYIVNWFYLANHGTEEVEANTPEEAIKLVWFGNTKKIKYVVSEKKHTTIFEREGSDK